MQTKIAIPMPEKLKVELKEYRNSLLSEVFQDLKVFDHHISRLVECVDFLLEEG